MYQVGQLIIYGTTGVCRVKDVKPAPKSADAEDRLYYTLEPLYQTCLIYAPVDGKVFMRPVISRTEAEKLIDGIPDVEPQVCSIRDLRQLREHYEAAIRSHDCAELIALSMSIYKKKRLAAQQKRRLGQTDQRFMKQAEELLFGELAAALDIQPEQVPDYISARTDYDRENA